MFAGTTWRLCVAELCDAESKRHKRQVVAWVVEAKPTAQALRAKGHMCKRLVWTTCDMANANAVGDEYESFGGEYSGGGETWGDVGRCGEKIIYCRAHSQ